MMIATLADLRKFIQPFMDECLLDPPFSIDYVIESGEGRLRVSFSPAGSSKDTQ
jgi:hypothetical protein